MSSLHEQLGRDAPRVLSEMMQANVPDLPKDYTVECHGNHYHVSKGDKTIRVPLYSAKNVFEALIFFS